MSSNLIPTTDLAYSLGTSTSRWNAFLGYASSTNFYSSSISALTIGATTITAVYVSSTYVTSSNIGVLDKLFISEDAELLASGPIVLNPLDVVTSTNWIYSQNASTTYESVRSLQVYNNRLYAGKGDSLGDGDIEVCNPNVSGNSSVCDAASDWSSSYSGGADRIQSLGVFNGKLYASERRSAGAARILYCDPSLSGGSDVCDTGDWITVTSTNFITVNQLISYNGVLYASADNLSVNGQHAILYCVPTNAGSANDCDAAADWGRVNFSGSYRRIPSLVVYLNRLYALMGGGSGDNDLFICNPGVAGSSLVCDNASDWLSSPIFEFYNSNESAAVYNGNLFMGKGDGLNDADLQVCSPGQDGDIKLCDSSSDYDIVLNNSGSWTEIPALSSIDGKLFIGLAGTTAGDGDILEFSVSLATTTNVGGNFEGTYAFASLNGHVYAGRGNTANEGQIFYKRIQRITSQKISFLAATSSGNLWFSDEAYSTTGEGSLQGVLSGAFKFSHGIVTEAGAYDVAEMYPAGEPGLESGDVVVFDQDLGSSVVKSSLVFDSHAFGVVSKRPALLIGSEKREGEVPIAIAGRVQVKFSAESGSVSVGDPLTTASMPGYAMKATGPGPIVGRAIQAFDAATTSTTGLVMMIVQPGYYVPSDEGIYDKVLAKGFLAVGDGSLPAIGPSTVASFTGTTNTYLQVNLQNFSTGTNASADYVATSDIGSDSSYYIAMGINNSQYLDPSFTINGANDGYVYVDGGNFTLGTVSSSDVIFHTGGSMLENERLRITSNGFVGIGTNAPSSTLHVVGSTTLSTLNFTQAVGTSVTTTNFYASDLAFENSRGSNQTLSGVLSVSGLTSLQQVTASAVTSTSIYATSLFVGGKRVCLEDGTNCGVSKISSASSSVSVSVGSETELLVVTSTPALSSNAVWVSAQVQAINSDAGNSALFTLRVKRGDTCASGVQIGVDRVVDVAASDSDDLSLSFVDQPYTVSPIAYRICASAVGGVTSVGGRSMSAQLISQGADLAEVYYTRSRDVGPGTVVSLDEAGEALVQPADRIYDSRVIGIISTRPGLLLAEQPRVDGSPVIVALSGRVPVRVTSANGAIKPGDYLTSSMDAGVAMKAIKAGYVLGQALTSFDGDGEGEVMVFIKNGFWNGQAIASREVQSGRSLLLKALSSDIGLAVTSSASTLNTDRVIASEDVIAQSFVGDSIAINRIQALSGDLRLEMAATGTYALFASGREQPVLRVDSLGLMSIGSLEADSVSSTSVVTQELIVVDLKSPVIDEIDAAIVTASTTIADIAAKLISTMGRLDRLEEQVTQLQSVDTPQAAFEGLLQIDQLSVAKESDFVGQVRVPGGLKVDQLSGIGDLVSFLSNVEFTGKMIVNRDTAGFAVITSGMKRVKVAFKDPYLVKPVVQATVTFDSLDNEDVAQEEMRIQNYFDQSMRYVVSRVTKEGFEIWFDKPVLQDVTFSWIALAPKNAEAVLSTDMNVSSDRAESAVQASSLEQGVNEPQPQSSDLDAEPVAPISEVPVDPVAEVSSSSSDVLDVQVDTPSELVVTEPTVSTEPQITTEVVNEPVVIPDASVSVN